MRLLVIAYPKSGTTGILRILRDVTNGTLQDNLRFGRGNKSLSLGSPNIKIFKDHSSLGPYLKEELPIYNFERRGTFLYPNTTKIKGGAAGRSGELESIQLSLESFKTYVLKQILVQFVTVYVCTLEC
jgi:hypothetical protein